MAFNGVGDGIMSILLEKWGAFSSDNDELIMNVLRGSRDGGSGGDVGPARSYLPSRNGGEGGKSAVRM